MKTPVKLAPSSDATAVRWLWPQLSPPERSALRGLDLDIIESLAGRMFDAVRVAWFGGVCVGSALTIFCFYLLSLLT